MGTTKFMGVAILIANRVSEKGSKGSQNSDMPLCIQKKVCGKMYRLKQALTFYRFTTSIILESGRAIALERSSPNIALIRLSEEGKKKDGG